jgi:cobalt-zinc-cadmium efflux system outer membrane protein
MLLMAAAVCIAACPAFAATSNATEVAAGTLIAAAKPADQPEPLPGAEPQQSAADTNSTSVEAAETPLSLHDALARALANHPGLAALDKEYWALDSIAWQEGRKPNPELEFELEEFGGTQDALGVRALATSLTYTQSVERGGKREKRETAASLERELVLWDIAELEHEIQAEVRSAFAAAQAAAYELEQLRVYRGLVQRIYDTVAASVEAGRSARLELERFEIELARLDLELASAERSLDQALLMLAGTWGGTVADFSAVDHPAGAPTTIPGLAELLPLVDSHPALERFDAEYEVLCAVLDLEHANAVGDMAWFGGVSRLNEINETVFKVGVAIDLTSNDGNEGNISAAARRLEQVEDLRAAVRLELETELTVLHRQAQNALDNYKSYSASLLPAANEALELTEEGYRYGKFELLDVLDSQRTVLELEREQTAALNELNEQIAAIEALLNISLGDLPEVDHSLDTTSTDSEIAVSEEQALEPATHEEHNHD